jgi:gas vesicle protein
MERKSGLLFSFLLGAAAGAAVGYLLANGKAEELTSDLKETAEKLKSEIDRQVEKGKEFIEDIKDKAEQTFNQG